MPRNPAAGFAADPATACPCRTLRTALWFVGVCKTAGFNPGDMRKVDLIRRRIRLYIDQERRPPGRKRRHAWINNALCQY